MFGFGFLFSLAASLLYFFEVYWKPYCIISFTKISAELGINCWILLFGEYCSPTPKHCFLGLSSLLFSKLLNFTIGWPRVSSEEHTRHWQSSNVATTFSLTSPGLFTCWRALGIHKWRTDSYLVETVLLVVKHSETKSTSACLNPGPFCFG